MKKKKNKLSSDIFQPKEKKQKKLFNEKFFKYVFLAVLTLIIVYFIIYIIFYGDGVLSTGKDLDKSDWLSFLASYLSFAGTISLGIVAIYQNIRADKLNQQMQMLQHASFVSMISAKEVSV